MGAMLDGRLAAGFSQIFGAFYRPGFLRRGEDTDDGTGSVKTCWSEFPCKVQVDRASRRQQSSGYPETDATLIILAFDLPEGVRDADEVEVDQVIYRIAAPTLDPLKSHWKCDARRKP